MTHPLRGRAALVTGASAGIGRATVLALARAGVDVIATGRRRAELDSLAELCRASGARTTVLAGDLNEAGFIDQLVHAAGHVDILVNNAAILAYAPLLETAAADCVAMFQTNVFAPFMLSQRIAARMAERRQGHLVFISSLAARQVHELGVAYAATKHALSAFAKGFRLELKPAGIKVTEIAPGMVDTELRRDVERPDVIAYFRTRNFTPLSPEDVAAAVVFSLSAEDRCCPDLIELRPRDR